MVVENEFELFFKGNKVFLNLLLKLDVYTVIKDK